MTINDARSLLSSGKMFLTCAGVETYLLFQQRFPLRDFCAFEVFQDEDAWKTLQERFLEPIASVALAQGFGLLADCLVWRASPDFMRALGYEEEALGEVNRQAVQRTRAFVDGWQAKADPSKSCPVVVAAEIGPRGDAYASAGENAADVNAAATYHRTQIHALAKSNIDLLVAWTMTSASEASGIALAARESGLPLILSPTVETDGRLPDRTTLGDFIEAVDETTESYPIFYMVNCAHPTHLAPELAHAAERDERWLERFRGLRANASAKSHEELDNSTSLDRGEPGSLASAIADLTRRHGLTVVGGCCGTDVEHLSAIAKACAR